MALTAEKLHEIVQALQDAQATRYLTAVGFVVLLYDHVLTFVDEVKLIWAAPVSFPKYAFLFNRYLVLACMLGVAYETCGFAGDLFTDLGCRRLLAATSILSLISTGIGNILVLLRVIILWDHRPIVFKLMSAGFVICFGTQIGMMIAVIVTYWPGVVWSSVAGMCAPMVWDPKLIGVWAAPMLFEVLVILSILLNALDRPHHADIPLAEALYRDGITYFIAVTCLRVLNLVLATAGRPSITLLGVFFVWGILTTTLNRSLLRMRRTEVDSKAAAELSLNASGRASPFGISSGNGSGVVIVDMDQESVASGSPRWLELKHIRSSSEP